MNGIDTLIDELCPEGVGFKELKFLANIGTGSRNGNEGVENGKYPLFVRSKIIKSINDFDFDEEAIIIPGEGSVGEIFHYMSGKYSLHQRAYRINLFDESIDMKFLYYFFNQKFKKFISKFAVNATVTSIRKPMIEKFEIPLIDIKIQQEIVKILDQFTELQENLTKELEQRKKEYGYVREELLRFDEEEINFDTINNILQRNRGTKITASQMNILNKKNGKVKIFGGGKTYALVNFDDIPEKDIIKEPSIIVKSRGIIEFEFFNLPFSHKNEFWSYYSDNSNIDIKFYFYYFKNKEPFFQDLGSKMQMPQISLSDIEKFKIPLPSIQIQKEIVSKLDKFDELVNEILPKEIELRQKQYEFYREKLLTFKELKSEENNEKSKPSLNQSSIIQNAKDELKQIKTMSEKLKEQFQIIVESTNMTIVCQKRGI